MASRTSEGGLDQLLAWLGPALDRVNRGQPLDGLADDEALIVALHRGGRIALLATGETAGVLELVGVLLRHLLRRGISPATLRWMVDDAANLPEAGGPGSLMQ